MRCKGSKGVCGEATPPQMTGSRDGFPRFDVVHRSGVGSGASQVSPRPSGQSIGSRMTWSTCIMKTFGGVRLDSHMASRTRAIALTSRRAWWVIAQVRPASAQHHEADANDRPAFGARHGHRLVAHSSRRRSCRYRMSFGGVRDVGDARWSTEARLKWSSLGRFPKATDCRGEATPQQMTTGSRREQASGQTTDISANTVGTNLGTARRSA